MKSIFRLGTGRANYGLYIALIVLLFIAFVVNIIWGASFFKISNLFNVARTSPILGVVSLGQAMVIISGGLDLSVGSLISTSDVVAVSIIDGVDQAYRLH